jgi:hypothetical protein
MSHTFRAFSIALLASCAASIAGVAAANEGAVERRSDQSYYVAMRDGVSLAVSLYFPTQRRSGTKAPAVLMQTRYGRAGLGKWFRTQRWLDDGFVVVAVDTRGSTASFGRRLTELSPEQIADVDEIVRHVKSQPWSSGQVFVAGQSYAADTADLATSRPAADLLGGVIHETEFDIYAHLMAPGGVINRGFLAEWGKMTRGMDLGRGGFDADAPPRDCLVRASDCAALYPVLQPVDSDRDYARLRAALAGKNRWLSEDLLNITFRDDKGHNGYGLFEISPAMQLDGLRQAKVPVQYWGSWMDGGTAESALARFRTLPEVPMEVWITANDHSNVRNADPFFPDVTAPKPALSDQLDLQTRFVRERLAGTKMARQIHYYVLGAGEFRTTSTWPVADARPWTLHLAGARALAERAGAAGREVYDVDFTVGTGARTRWSTQIGTPPAYADRREIDRRLLTFDSAPLEGATELVGTPVVKLVLSTLSDDPAVFVYLEDVAPDGRVTYLTEGMFRAIHRRPADPSSLPYDQGPAPHSFRRADAELVHPGEVMTIEFPLMPVAALIRPGHRLRLAIAGADKDWFTVYSNGGPERFDIRIGEGGSHVTLPVRPWR